jgi:hypothetical protein
LAYSKNLKKSNTTVQLFDESFKTTTWSWRGT